MFDVEMMPPQMKAYLRNYGYSFSKKACEWAVRLMRRENATTGKMERIEPYTREKAESLLGEFGIELENNIGYNFVYVINMALADYWKGTIEDEEHLARYVKETIDDVDGNPENLFRMWIAKMDGDGIPIPWEELL